MGTGGGLGGRKVGEDYAKRFLGQKGTWVELGWQVSTVCIGWVFDDRSGPEGMDLMPDGKVASAKLQVS